MFETDRRIRHYLCNSKALPYRRTVTPNKAMLTGKELGEALRIAIERKSALKESRGEGRLFKKDVALHFEVKPPSITDWIDHGRIGKQHLNKLVAYFSDVVGPHHWGIDVGARFTAVLPESEAGTYTSANVAREGKESTVLTRSARLADQIVSATKTGLLDERGIALLEKDLRRYVGAIQAPQEHDASGTLSDLSEPEGKAHHGRRARGRKGAG